MSKQPPPAPTASAVGPCPTTIKIVGRPGTGRLPRAIASPDHPRQGRDGVGVWREGWDRIGDGVIDRVGLGRSVLEERGGIG